MKNASDNIGKWELPVTENVYVGAFDNTDREAQRVTPGMNGDNALTRKFDVCGGACVTEYNADDFSYGYMGGDYFYGITKDNKEIIAASDGKNALKYIFNGAGKFRIMSKKDVLAKTADIKSFNVIKNGGYEAVKVFYNTDAVCDYVAQNSILYTFKERCIDISAVFKCTGLPSGLYRGNCRFLRSRLCEPDETKTRVSYNWIYPENNDFAYKETDALVVSERYGDICCYTFVRDKNSSKLIPIAEIDSLKLPLEIKNDTTEIDYVYDMSICFEKSGKEESYRALFKGRNSEFAAGIAAVDNKGFDTLFSGKEVCLNLNVTNLCDKKLPYSVKYNVLDYYSNIIDNGTFYGDILEGNAAGNRNINLCVENYGMYYLNLYVTTENNEYRECYPFAMLEPHEYRNRKNPFFICGIHAENEGEAEATAETVKKIGVAGVRFGRSYNNEELYKVFCRNGVTRITKGIGGNTNPDKIEEYAKAVKEDADAWINRYEYYLMANEMDTKVKGNYDKCKKFINDVFYPCTFKPAYDYIYKNYPECKNVVWESNCHGSTEWFEAFKEAGIWDASDVIDVHSYSSPSGPDKCFSNQLSSMYASMFSNEYAAVRWKRICRRYGEKRLIIGETGYPTTPANINMQELDIRTQADFNTRIALFFLEAKAEMINYYCLYDRTSVFVGSGGWNEMYFGAMYSYDYYGVHQPKPWAAALANLVRRFEGCSSCEFFDKYEEDEQGTLRAFNVKTENGKFAVLWSNIYMLPNTTAEGRVSNTERIPLPAWQSRWTKSEKRTFDAEGGEVTVIDIMGSERHYKPENGKVTLEITGSPIFVYGIK